MSHSPLFYSPEISQNDLLKMKMGFCHCLVGNYSVASPIVCRVSSEALSMAHGARLTGLSFSPPWRPRTPSSSVPQECQRNLLCSPFHQQFPGMEHKRAGDRKLLKIFPWCLNFTPLSPPHYWWWLWFLNPQLSLDILPNLHGCSFWNLLKAVNFLALVISLILFGKAYSGNLLIMCPEIIENVEEKLPLGWGVWMNPRRD